MDAIPDPEVPERPTRRRFTAAYKVVVLDELDRATEPGSKGAIIRRDGLYAATSPSGAGSAPSAASKPWADREAHDPPTRSSPRTSGCATRWDTCKRGPPEPRR